MFVIKIPTIFNYSKLIEREIDNYQNLNYPLLPKMYGTIKCTDCKCLIIEFLDGSTLVNIKKFHFNEDEKITIIFQLMLIINYLHKNQFIYRDLKPDNVIIDDNNTAFIIDFDNMIKFTETTDNEQHTLGFSTVYVAPEAEQGKVCYANDIYSLGQMIYYIFNEKDPEFERQKTSIPSLKIHKFNKYMKFARMT